MEPLSVTSPAVALPAAASESVTKIAPPDKGTHNPPTLGLNIIHEAGGDPADIIADIVAVHGFSGDPERSWTAANGVMWLRELLPRDLPSTRVFSWGYAGMSYPSKSVESIEDHAKTLVHDFSRKRILSGTPKDRSIIFIGYDIGGIILKRALLYSHKLATSTISRQYVPIHELTSGVIFIATPHQSLFKHYALSFLSIYIPLGATSSYGRRLRSLDKNPRVLKSENEHFVELASRFGFHVVSAYETLTTSFGIYSTMFVPTESAIIEGMESELIALHANHRNAPMFTGSSDPNYVRISESLSLMIQRLSRSASSAEDGAQLLLASSEGDACPSYTQCETGGSTNGHSHEEIRSRSSSDGIKIENLSREVPSLVQQLNVKPEKIKTDTIGTTSNFEYPPGEQTQRTINGQLARIIRATPALPQDTERSVRTVYNGPPTPPLELAPTSKVPLPSSIVPSSVDALKAVSSLSLKAGQNSAAATLDATWTKVGIAGAAATATATVAINAVNANTSRRVADINERSATIAERAADASEQNALAALSAADTAAKKLVFDQEESMKKKAKEEEPSNGTTMNNNAISGSFKSAAPSKIVLPSAVSPTKPSSTQVLFEARVRKRYEEREIKKHAEKQKLASNIRAFKNRLKHPFKGVSSAKEEELDRKLREQRSNHDQHGHGEEARNTEVDNPKSRRNRKGKERDMGSVVSGSSTSADMADGDGVESEVVRGQATQPGPSASPTNGANGEIDHDSAKESLKSANSEEELRAASGVGKQHPHQPESESSSSHSVNLTEQEDIHLNTLPPSTSGPSASSPEPAVTENILPAQTVAPGVELPLPVGEPAEMIVKETLDSTTGSLKTPSDVPLLHVDEEEEREREVAAKDTSGVVPSKSDQEETSPRPKEI